MALASSEARRQSQNYLRIIENYLNTELLVEIPKPFAPNSISFEELQWAWYVVKTRSWADLQIPWADMFNHHPDGVCVVSLQATTSLSNMRCTHTLASSDAR
jgi:hypothetical protein